MACIPRTHAFQSFLAPPSPRERKKDPQLQSSTADTRCSSPLSHNSRKEMARQLQPSHSHPTTSSAHPQKTGNTRDSTQPGGSGADGENESAPERRPFAGETRKASKTATTSLPVLVPEWNAPALRSRARSRRPRRARAGRGVSYS
jgi:hypothetical protein